MRSSAREEGFSVLEVLIALSVLSVLMVALTGVSYFARAISERTATNISWMKTIAAAQEFLSDCFSQVQVNSQGGAASISGDTRKIQIWSQGPHVLGLTRAAEIVLSVPERGTGLDLQWRAGSKQSGRVEFIAKDAAISFRYFSAERGWTDRWEERRSPSAVGILMTSADDPSLFADFVFSVRAVSATTCDAGFGRSCWGY
jgi:prepilin-type N-terminal cleavage/methylation domain-containing protein